MGDLNEHTNSLEDSYVQAVWSSSNESGSIRMSLERNISTVRMSLVINIRTVRTSSVRNISTSGNNHSNRDFDHHAQTSVQIYIRSHGRHPPLDKRGLVNLPIAPPLRKDGDDTHT
jgi:hypothetical protein